MECGAPHRQGPEGHAELLPVVPYWEDLPSGKRTIAYKMGPPKTIKTKGERLFEFIESREKRQIMDLMKELLLLRYLFQFTVHVDVCKNCLSLAFEIGIWENGNHPFITHKCDFKLAIDHSSKFEPKDIVIQHLENKVGFSILAIMNFLSPSQHVIHVNPDEELEYFRAEKRIYEKIRRHISKEDEIFVTEEFIRDFDEKEKNRLQQLREADATLALDPKEFSRIRNTASQNNGVPRFSDLITVLQILKRSRGIYRVQSPRGDQYFEISVI
jgi:hypothetical protein